MVNATKRALMYNQTPTRRAIKAEDRCCRELEGDFCALEFCASPNEWDDPCYKTQATAVKKGGDTMACIKIHERGHG
jgi:hypothetical protein